MDTNPEWYSQLTKALPDLELKRNEPLAQYSTVKIGGPAELLALPKSTDQLIATLREAYSAGIPVTMLGWGANTLIADRGISGLVIKPVGQEIRVISAHERVAQAERDLAVSKTTPRWSAGKDAERYANFSELDYAESGERVLVQTSTGTPLPSLINQLLQQGITGLQWFSKIPATVGGAIFNNIHGGTYYFGDLTASVRVFTPSGDIIKLTNNQLELGYDYSRFHHTHEVILDLELLLFRGDVARAKTTIASWARQKSIQPPNSLGCIFQNLTAEDQARLQLSTPSIGYVIEHLLKLKGFVIGDAQVSTKHAAFIENLGAATAHDYLSVIKKIMSEAESQLQLKLIPEIFFYGFTPTELTGINA